ncbi:hypothetical protein CKA32_001222 [Geitlerinema sp. FC II]|nr:hypothetical protein CKA32_001222 [Geitlerinema sp. FC II]
MVLRFDKGDRSRVDCKPIEPIHWQYRSRASQVDCIRQF